MFGMLFNVFNRTQNVLGQIKIVKTKRYTKWMNKQTNNRSNNNIATATIREIHNAKSTCLPLDQCICYFICENPHNVLTYPHTLPYTAIPLQSVSFFIIWIFDDISLTDWGKQPILSDVKSFIKFDPRYFFNKSICLKRICNAKGNALHFTKGKIEVFRSFGFTIFNTNWENFYWWTWWCKCSWKHGEPNDKTESGNIQHQGRNMKRMFRQSIKRKWKRQRKKLEWSTKMVFMQLME